MKRNSGFILAAITALLLYGCFGSGGSSAPAPTNVAVVAKDSRVIVTWDMTPGVDYWIWKAAASGVTPDNCSSLPSCGVAVGVTSPASISVANGSTLALTNGTAYSFSINARTNGGPGGVGSPAVDATPRLSGATWSAGTPVSSSTLRGVTYGNLLVAVGDNGAVFSSTDVSNSSTNGSIWTAATSNPAAGTTTTLYAVSYDASLTRYFVAGAGGMILQSTDAATWTQLTGNTTSDLYAVANNGGTTIVAAGANGTITTTTNSGSTWTAQTITGAPALYGIAYGHSNSTTAPGNIFVAVGAGGTVRYSADGLNWTAAASPSTSSDIKGVTYGLINGVGTFVAVTANGYVITSTDGSSWTAPDAVSPLTTLNAIAASANAATPLSTTVTTVTNAFVAVDNAGNIFRSTDGGLTWPQVGTSATPLYAVTRGGLYDYSAVGAAGTNLYAD